MNVYLRFLKNHSRIPIISIILLILVAFPISSLSHSYKPSSPGGDTQPVNVQINVPSTVPLEILNVQVTPTPSGMSGMHYVLRNDSGQALIAAEIRWTISTANGPAIIEANDSDAWMKASGMLAPGAEMTYNEGALVSKGPSPVTGVAATITYAEFADGTRVGPDANGAVYQRLRADRLAVKTACQQLLGTYRTGGKEALLDAIHSIGTSAQTMAYREARMMLDQFLQKQGFDAMVQDLQRVAAQKVP